MYVYIDMYIKTAFASGITSVAKAVLFGECVGSTFIKYFFITTVS